MSDPRDTQPPSSRRTIIDREMRSTMPPPPGPEHPVSMPVFGPPTTEMVLLAHTVARIVTKGMEEQFGDRLDSMLASLAEMRADMRRQDANYRMLRSALKRATKRIAVLEERVNAIDGKGTPDSSGDGES